MSHTHLRKAKCGGASYNCPVGSCASSQVDSLRHDGRVEEVSFEKGHRGDPGLRINAFSLLTGCHRTRTCGGGDKKPPPKQPPPKPKEGPPSPGLPPKGKEPKPMPGVS